MIYNDFNAKDLHAVIATKDADKISQYLTKYNLEVVGGMVKPIAAAITDWKLTEDYFDKRQLVRKILLNSALA